MKWILILLLILSAPALADQGPIRLEALYGRCNQTLAGDGIWWNSAYPNNADTDTNCWQLGASRIETQYRSWDIGWRLAYVDFGTLRWQASYPLVDAEQHTVNPSGENCNLTTRAGCVGTGNHKQTTKGLTLGAIAEHRLGPTTIGGDLGIYVYNSTFSYSIASPLGAGQDDFGGLGASPYLGVTLRYGWLFAQGRLYAEIKAHESGCGDCSGLTNGPATQLMVGISVPLGSKP